MAKNYNDYAYFENRPDVVKIFDDLDKLLDFCRLELLPFNQADLYNRMSPVWNQYYQSTRPRKPWNGEKKPWTGERKPYQGNKPRYNQ
jgi:hypothetical protein